MEVGHADALLADLRLALRRLRIPAVDRIVDQMDAVETDRCLYLGVALGVGQAVIVAARTHCAAIEGHVSPLCRRYEVVEPCAGQLRAAAEAMMREPRRDVGHVAAKYKGLELALRAESGS